MNKYNTFLFLFITSIIAFIVFMVFYLQGVFTLVVNASEHSENSPLEVLRTIFSPAVVISLAAAAGASLINRILAIVMIAKNKIISDGEKVIWIIGFVIMSFITSIVFLIMAKGKKFTE
jgi:tellurite resistance protein TehA-like permease